MATREQLIEDFADHKYATGEKFERLINSMKVVQEPVETPAASGTSLSFIDSIEQDADGKITATKKTLDLANAHELNPFKGWYKTGDTLPTSGFDGAYLYFKDTTQTPAVTTIYQWNGTTYADTGTVVDTSNVQTFASGQAVNGVYIKNDFTGGEDDVLSAEMGKNLNEQINGVTQQHSEILTATQTTPTEWYLNLNAPTSSNYIQINNNSAFPNSKTKFYKITPGKTYNIVIPKSCNQYTGSWAYSNAPWPDSPTTPAQYLEGAKSKSENLNYAGNGGRQEFTIESARDFEYIVVSFDNGGGEPTVTESYTTIEGGIKPDVEKNKEDIEGLQSDVDGLKSIEIVLPNVIHAVVGDTLQLFFNGMVKVKDVESYDIRVSCLKGKQYRRYFEYTPTSSSEIGETNFILGIYSMNGALLSEKTSILKTVAAPVSPNNEKHVVLISDSLLAKNQGKWASELNRRLTGAVGTGTPAANGLTNLVFCGNKVSTHEPQTNYVGNGGWTWGSYVSAGERAYRFTVYGVTSIVRNTTYTNNGYTFIVSEVDVDAGTGAGSILCTIPSGDPSPLTNGVLVKTGTGAGDNEIAYSDATLDNGNPLWDAVNSQVSFEHFSNQYCGGQQIDAVYFLLTYNGLGLNLETPINMNTVKVLANALHRDFPNAKFKIMSEPAPSTIDSSINGADGKLNLHSYSDCYGLKCTILNMAKQYQDFANEEGYADFVEYVEVLPEFDSDNGYPTANKTVNTRSTQVEKYCTNTIHPTEESDCQIADTVYRSIVACFCQPQS